MAKTALKIFINKGVAPSQKRYPGGVAEITDLKMHVFYAKKALKCVKNHLLSDNLSYSFIL